MSIKYKLTDQDMYTRNNTKWVLGIPKHTNGKGVLCGPGWLHCYSHPLLAITLNPLHARITNPRLFKCDATGNHKYDNGLKEGCTTMVLLKEIPVPSISKIQIIAFNILYSLEVYKNPKYIIWANNWLDNKDRSYVAAYAAAYAADAHAATNTAHAATADTAFTAYAAANAAANAANAAAIYAATRATAYAAAYAAANATYTAANAAARAAHAAATKTNINLIKLIKKAIKY